MKISSAVFAGSSTRVEKKPQTRLPEFAFVGRSNVGKSSLINMLCNSRKLAMTSSTPGKTRLVNHFLIDGKWYLVDLPGYGYAKGSQKERDAIREVINDYVTRSEDMTMLFVLLDSRHEPGKADLEFLQYIGENGIPFAIIFTKGDKLGPNALAARIEKDKQILLESWEELPPIFISSSEKNQGREDILDYIESVLSSLS